MTYLQLVNAVLRRLREDEVTSVNTSYARLIGDFINDTIREAGDAWNWHSGRTTKAVTTSSGDGTYELTGVGRRFRYLSVWNVTNNGYLTQVSQPYMDYLYNSSDNQTGQPNQFATNSFSSTTDNPQIDLFPVPDAAYTIYFNLYIPAPELSDDDDICQLPSNMIILGAWAKAISERGEDGGQNTIEQQLMYKSALSDAIAMDESLTVGETTWLPS